MEGKRLTAVSGYDNDSYLLQLAVRQLQRLPLPSSLQRSLPSFSRSIAAATSVERAESTR
jgi:hypothetical protein